MTLPEEFSTYTSKLFGEKLWTTFLRGMQEQPPVSVRLNPFKHDAATMPLPSDEDGMVEWCPEGRYLQARPQFTLDPLLHAGAYYVQEAASMYVTDVVRRFADLSAPLRVLDLCAGSGCIGLAIAHQLPDAHVTLADISRPALAVAKRNIKRLKLMNRVTAVGLDARKRGPSFVGTLDALVCNPPYVTSEEMTRLEPSVKEYEPALALDGGKDGLAFYRTVAENFTHLLADGGYLCFEFGLGQHVAVSMILQEYGYTDIVLRKDLRGVVRAVRGKKK